MSYISNSFGYKTIWYAIKESDVCSVKELTKVFGLKQLHDTRWDKGIETLEEEFKTVVVSGPYKGWYFVVGKCLDDATKPDRVEEMLKKLSNYSKEVAYYCSHRTVGLYGFAKLLDGKLKRMYCYSGENGHIYRAFGKETKEEHVLKLNLPHDDEDIAKEGFNELDEEKILELAGELSLSPEVLPGMDEKKTILGQI